MVEQEKTTGNSQSKTIILKRLVKRWYEFMHDYYQRGTVYDWLFIILFLFAKGLILLFGDS